MRSSRSSLALGWDPSRAEHLKLLQAMNNDARIRAAAHPVNSFRLDTRGAGETMRGIKIGACRDDGVRAGEVQTDREFADVYRLLAPGWRKARGGALSNFLPRVRQALCEIARAEHQVARLQPDLVSSRSGKIRDHVARTMSRMQRLKASWSEALEKLKHPTSD